MRVLILVLALFIISACSQGNGQVNQSNQTTPTVTPTPQIEKAKSTENECKICDFDFAGYKGDLKKEEIDGLLLALNDEYMAWATYDQINKDFNNPRPFSNIQQAEARHAERLKVVFKTYNLPVPENKWIGDVPKFQTVIEACKAGVEAEIANRDLYKRLFETTTREDILVVYRALQRASEENHLPAFQRCGEGRGGRSRPL
ncbi:MAG: DUF2202 domain-containing protein [Blastocatellia bacterium]|nr:DUF2202 domain-containing protein [Blastocatellia bacterium]